MEFLSEAEQKILNELIEAQFTMDSITAVENFILGFRLGVRMILECIDDNDDDIREVTNDGQAQNKRRREHPQTERWSLGRAVHSRS